MKDNTIYSLKDFELSTKMEARVRAEEFKKYIAQMNEFGCKSYWVMANTGVGAQNGDLSRLPEYIEVCKKHGAMLMVDDAHGIGVMGENGRGTAEHFGCLGQADIITGTFSKSFGCVGGFVAASKELIQYLRYYADSNIFSAAITPQVTASVLKAMELIKAHPEIRKKLWDNVHYLRQRMKEEGFDVGESESPIFPVMVRDNKKCMKYRKNCKKEVSLSAELSIQPCELRKHVCV